MFRLQPGALGPVAARYAGEHRHLLRVGPQFGQQLVGQRQQFLEAALDRHIRSLNLIDRGFLKSALQGRAGIVQPKRVSFRMQQFDRRQAVVVHIALKRRRDDLACPVAAQVGRGPAHPVSPRYRHDQRNRRIDHAVAPDGAGQDGPADMTVVLVLRAACYPDAETDFIRLRVACADFRLFLVIRDFGAHPIAAMVCMQLEVDPGFSNGFGSFRHAMDPFWIVSHTARRNSAVLSLWDNHNA